LPSDRDENIQCKAYSAEFGQPDVFISIQMELPINKFLYKKSGPNFIEIRKCLHKVFTLHILYINRTYISTARGPWPLQIFRISSHFVL